MISAQEGWSCFRLPGEYSEGVNKTELIGYLERLDRALAAPATLHIYGSAAFMMLDEPDRTSLDIDVAIALDHLTLAAVEEGLEISHVADLPGRTGLGSSSSFTVGLLRALHALRGDRATPEDLAREAIEIGADPLMLRHSS